MSHAAPNPCKLRNLWKVHSPALLAPTTAAHSCLSQVEGSEVSVTPTGSMNIWSNSIGTDGLLSPAGWLTSMIKLCLLPVDGVVNEEVMVS